MAAYTLRQVQDSMGVVSAAIVDPVLQLLKTLHIDLQQEGGCGLGEGSIAIVMDSTGLCIGKWMGMVFLEWVWSFHEVGVACILFSSLSSSGAAV